MWSCHGFTQARRRILVEIASGGAFCKQQVGPDRQMVGGPPRKFRLNHARIAQGKGLGEGDPVQRGNRARGVKGPARRMNVEGVFKWIKSLPAGPFVEISEDHRGPVVEACEVLANGVKLFLSRGAQQAKMHADHTQLGQVHSHRSAWLQSRQVETITRLDGCAFAHKDGIAVPADRDGRGVDGQGGEIRMRLDHPSGQRGWPWPQPQIGLLQCDDIGLKAVDHVNDTSGRALPVGAFAFAQII